MGNAHEFMRALYGKGIVTFTTAQTHRDIQARGHLQVTQEGRDGLSEREEWETEEEGET